MITVWITGGEIACRMMGKIYVRLYSEVPGEIPYEIPWGSSGYLWKKKTLVRFLEKSGKNSRWNNLKLKKKTKKIWRKFQVL